METLKNRLTARVSKAFADCGYDASLGIVSPSDRQDLCQFQCNGALSAARQYRKNPAIIANAIIDAIKSDTMFSRVEFAPPGFINLTLSDEFLSGEINEILADKRAGLPIASVPKKIVLDYGGPNVAKPLHIGHLRTAIIGEALKRLCRFLGHDVIGDIHLGDWGLQMGLIITELCDRRPDLIYFDDSYTGEYPSEPPVTIDDLNSLYPEASKRSKQDAQFLKRAQQATNDLQNARRGYVALWTHFMSVSVQDLKKSYARLNVSFDTWLGESNSARFVPELLKILEEKKLTYISDGALIADVALDTDEEPIPPIIISKSDGSQLYATTDLATILQRVYDFNPDECWYVVDNRQAMHFKQVFRLAKKSGIAPESLKLCHVGFGTMNGKDGKPYKTRDGGVMRLSDLIDSAVCAAREKTSDELSDVAEQVGIAALKFGDLINHRTKDYVFDMDRFLASEGKTGPYLQYSAVRINSVLKKAAELDLHAGKIIAPRSETERALMLKLTSVGDVLLRAFEEKAPNCICEVCFDIAGLFNRFYFENKIITCPDESVRASWLSLIKAVHGVLSILLDILATNVPERM